MGDHTLRTPEFARQMQRLYDRYDLLCDACYNLKWAVEALRQCRDADQAENLTALEQIGEGVTRDRDAVQIKLEQLEALEQSSLALEAERVWLL